MSSPTTPIRGQGLSWQERLQDHCRSARYPAPVFNIVSDRRGGRTAWSSTVVIPNLTSTSQQVVQARYWYDGEHLNNAREDAAEVALRVLTGNSPTGSGGSSSGGGGGGGGGGGANGGYSNGTGGAKASWSQRR